MIKKLISNLLISIILFITLSITILTIIGHRFYVVKSDSMAPTIYKNALVIVRLNNLELQKEDIIAFKVSDELVMHRIKEINDGKIITKGDANNSYDSPINYTDVIGKVIFHIPFIGILFKSIYIWLIIILAYIMCLLVARLRKELKNK